MKLAPLVEHAVGLPFRQIAGALELAGLPQRGGRLPALFFVPAGASAAPNTLASGAIDQRVQEEFLAVLLIEPNNRDDGTTSDRLDELEQAVIGRFLGWRMPGASAPTTFAASSLAGVATSQITWVIRFRTAHHLRKTS